MMKISYCVQYCWILLARWLQLLPSNPAIAPGQTKHVIQEIQLNNPSLWSIDEPNLYNAKVSVLINDIVVDDVATHFGIRSIEIDAQNGFTINGKPVKIIGGNIHHDNGPLGAASIDRAEERKIEITEKEWVQCDQDGS